MECIVYERKDLRFTSCPCVTLRAVSAYQLTMPYFTCTAKTEQNQNYQPFSAGSCVFLAWNSKNCLQVIVVL